MNLRPTILAAAGALLAPCLFAQSAPPPAAQTEEELLADLRALEMAVARRSQISFSLRLGGHLKAKFLGVGAIASDLDISDTTTEEARTYNDGYVGADTRSDTDGEDMASDGRTNNWSYNAASQVTADETGVSFHRYETISDGSTISAKSKPAVGIDVEGARQFFSFGRSLGVGRKAFTGGAHFGIGLSTLNAKSTGNITATLLSITDTYSLLGAAPPGGSPTDEDSTGYTAPSSSSETVTNADGTTTSNTIDTTTYLGSLPDSRTEAVVPGGATIDGLWQVRGAFFNVRTGPWIRWQPSDRFSLRFSAGGSMNFVGVKMRYDETLDLEDLSTALTQRVESDSENMAVPGYFGGIDAEWWFSDTTGFFGSASYEKATKDKLLTYEGRTAELEMSSGLGLRAGLTVKF